MSERDELLSLYSDLRVADVRDGMDWNLLHWQGTMSPDIRPLWRTRAVGIARTARYLPYAGTIPSLTPDEYTELKIMNSSSATSFSTNELYIMPRSSSLGLPMILAKESLKKVNLPVRSTS